MGEAKTKNRNDVTCNTSTYVEALPKNNITRENLQRTRKRKSEEKEYQRIKIAHHEAQASLGERD